MVYAYGTNTGIRAVAAGEHGHTEDELRYVRRRYITVESCRQVARVIANATFATRQPWLRGEGPTAAASDSTEDWASFEARQLGPGASLPLVVREQLGEQAGQDLPVLGWKRSE
ncbi:hypothetical protein GCM10023317_23500 [Actinopolymorpha pittospori]|uniref:Tn3 transposase DDE domain-containing protein n=1 Tax=Actinopolymorpha pittospori TaxID=648752 RepID=A0A927RHB1_9ACTN|nr:hypothetical protein [Actinopolymorpha pittospori]